MEASQNVDLTEAIQTEDVTIDLAVPKRKKRSSKPKSKRGKVREFPS